MNKNEIAATDGKAAPMDGAAKEPFADLKKSVEDSNKEMQKEAFDDACVGLNEPIKADDFVYLWSGTEFAPRNNIISLKAAPKAGKTFALTAFALAALLGEYDGLEATADNLSVLYFDTEQSRNDSRKILHRIANEGADMSRFSIYNLRTYPTAKRLLAVTTLAKQLEPDIIIIDGIADLLEGMDYNNTELSVGAITLLEGLAESLNALIIVAIHVNNKDDNATGWLGRILKQKCAIEMIIKRDKGTALRTIEGVSVRHREFDPITFEIQNTADGLGRIDIQDPQQATQAIAESKRREYRDRLLEIGIEPPLVCERAAFAKMVQEKKSQVEAKTCTKQNANGLIKRCLNANALRVDGNNIIFDDI